MTTGTPDQERHVREVLDSSHVDDWGAFRLTTCYAADRCQGDLCCPFTASCHRVNGAYWDDEDFDD